MSSSTNIFVRGSSGAAKCRVHPVVLFNVVDHYSRRSEGTEKVIGTLLGSKLADGTVEIKDSYPVPYEDTAESVAVDTNYHKFMYELHRKVSSKSVIVGCRKCGEVAENSFSSGFCLSKICGLEMPTHVFLKETNSPVYLCLDCLMSEGRLGMKTFISNDVLLDGEAVATQFVPIPCEKAYTPEEKAGVDYLKRLQVGGKVRRANEAMFNDLESLEKSMRKLMDMIDSTHRHVGRILSGEDEPNPKLGRHLMDTIMELPKLKLEQFEDAFQQNLQDLLMVSYLSTLTRAQLQLAVKFPKA